MKRAVKYLMLGSLLLWGIGLLLGLATTPAECESGCSAYANAEHHTTSILSLVVAAALAVGAVYGFVHLWRRTMAATREAERRV